MNNENVPNKRAVFRGACWIAAVIIIALVLAGSLILALYISPYFLVAIAVLYFIARFGIMIARNNGRQPSR
jgi:hypothetical protein